MADIEILPHKSITWDSDFVIESFDKDDGSYNAVSFSSEMKECSLQFFREEESEFNTLYSLWQEKGLSLSLTLTYSDVLYTLRFLKNPKIQISRKFYFFSADFEIISSLSINHIAFLVNANTALLIEENVALLVS